MAFVHPAIGTLTILLAVWLMSRGLVARQGAKHSTAARRLHKRWGPWGLAGMALSGVTGALSMVLLREDLAVGDTWHLPLGLLSIALMAATALATRRFASDPRLRTVHLLLGAAAVAVCLLQGIVGIELLP